jgi:hypothetical protein
MALHLGQLVLPACEGQARFLFEGCGAFAHGRGFKEGRV